MKEDTVKSCVQLSWHCLKKMAQMYHLSNPSLSRYYLSRSVKMKRKASLSMQGNRMISKKSTNCFHCFTMFEPGNHSIRIKPRKRLSHNISKLLAKNKDDPKQLGSFHKNMVDTFLHNKNKLIISCFTCKKSLKVGCQSHEDRMQQKQLLEHDPEEIEEKVKTKKQRQREKRNKMKKNKKFCKFLFDNEEEAEAAAKKRNQIQTEDSEQSSVPFAEMPVLKPTETPNRQSLQHTLPKNPNVTQTKYSSKSVDKASRTSIRSHNSLVSKKSANVVSVVKSNLLSKKKKGRDYHQQLQKVLEADKCKNTGNSLADFLSSL